MPRRNRTPKHTLYQNKSARAPQKKRFANRQAALNAIKELQKTTSTSSLTFINRQLTVGGI